MQTYRSYIFIHKDFLFLFQLFAGKYFFVWWRESMGFERRAWLRPRGYWKKRGPTETRTRIVGFKVQSDSHYTIGPPALMFRKINYKKRQKSLYFLVEQLKSSCQAFYSTFVFKEFPIGIFALKIFTFLQWKNRFEKNSKYKLLIHLWCGNFTGWLKSSY